MRSEPNGQFGELDTVSVAQLTPTKKLRQAARRGPVCAVLAVSLLYDSTPAASDRYPAALEGHSSLSG